MYIQVHSIFYACPHYLQVSGSGYFTGETPKRQSLTRSDKVWQISYQRWQRKVRDIIFFNTQGHLTRKWLVRSGRNSNPSNISCLSSIFHYILMHQSIVAMPPWGRAGIAGKKCRVFTFASCPSWVSAWVLLFIAGITAAHGKTQ